MSIPINNIVGTVPIQVIVGEPMFPPVPDGEAGRPPLWRVKHDRELGALWRPNLPEIHPFSPSHFVPFNEAWQRYSFGLNTMDKNEWTSVFSDTTAFVNNQGFGKGGDPRANYIKGENLRSPVPKLEALVCGGAVLTGSVAFSLAQTLQQVKRIAKELPTMSFGFFRQSVRSLLDPNVLHTCTLDGRDAPPRRALEPWEMYHAVTVDSRGIPRLFPQGDGQPVILALVADRDRYQRVTFPMYKLVRVPDNAPIPSPYL